MDYDYEYDDAERYGGRILWGRIAVYGVAFVLVFLIGSWWGGRGAANEERVVELQAQVEALQAENRDLQDTVDAMSAGEREEEPSPAEDEEDVAEEPEEEPADEGQPETRTYLVQPGDTLRGIANEVYGDPDQWEVIAEANGLTRETVLTVGQELVIPPSEDGDS